LSFNCGRCGKPLYKPGLQVCDNCRKVITHDKNKHAKKEQNRYEQEVSLYQNLTAPGEEEAETIDDKKYQHYMDTHDASAVWVDRDGGKKGKRKR